MEMLGTLMAKTPRHQTSLHVWVALPWSDTTGHPVPKWAMHPQCVTLGFFQQGQWNSKVRHRRSPLSVVFVFVCLFVWSLFLFLTRKRLSNSRLYLEWNPTVRKRQKDNSKGKLETPTPIYPCPASVLMTWTKDWVAVRMHNTDVWVRLCNVKPEIHKNKSHLEIVHHWKWMPVLYCRTSTDLPRRIQQVRFVSAKVARPLHDLPWPPPPIWIVPHQGNLRGVLRGERLHNDHHKDNRYMTCAAWK